MFHAMNRFHIAIGHEEAFEAIWKGRDSRLKDNPGFREFRLLRGETKPESGYTLFVSSSIWDSHADFVGWTKSENFRSAHKSAGDSRAMYLGPPVFEGFSVVEGA